MLNVRMDRRRPTIVALLTVILGVGVLLPGCEQAPQEAKKSVTTVEKEPPVKPAEVEIESPVEPVEVETSSEEVAEKVEAEAETPVEPSVASVPPSSILEQVEACADLIELHEKAAELSEAGTSSTEVSAAIDAKHETLLAEAKTFQFGDSIELLDVDFRSAGLGKSEARFLFLPKKKLPVQIKIHLNAHVDKSHADYLSDDADKEHLNEVWRFWPIPRATEWTPGEQVLIMATVNAQPIPYNLKMGVSGVDGSGLIGTYLDLGWYAALDEE